MNKGYFNLENKLESIIIKPNITAYDFLHGSCEKFALALNKVMNYRIILWIDYHDDIKRNALLHAFNVFNFKGKTYYADIRGITDNIEDIMNEFDYYEEPDMYEYNYNEAVKVLHNLKLNDDVSIELFNYIKKNKSNYTME
ncbi:MULTISPECIES: hypothetical protein [Clostridium]|jgi:hypothetical protein|uniref:hypothetical protein n=1 Tax=Clostridium TaxID=1485 RepID=UPI000E9CDE35|nr:hypothetical protein [Clostridium tyrobutyricum]HBF77174.1 hypothetical protein [Clostridiaceae bacterium]